MHKFLVWIICRSTMKCFRVMFVLTLKQLWWRKVFGFERFFLSSGMLWFGENMTHALDFNWNYFEMSVLQGTLYLKGMWWLIGKAVVDSGLKGPGFNPWPRQDNVKNLSSCFELVALEPMISTSKKMLYLFVYKLGNK